MWGGSIARPSETHHFMKETTTKYKHTDQALTMMKFGFKQRNRFGCWNVRTMQEGTRFTQIVKEMQNYNISVLGLSEIRWGDNGKLQLNDGELLLYSCRPADADHRSWLVSH